MARFEQPLVGSQVTRGWVSSIPQPTPPSVDDPRTGREGDRADPSPRVGGQRFVGYGSRYVCDTGRRVRVRTTGTRNEVTAFCAGGVSAAATGALDARSLCAPGRPGGAGGQLITVAVRQPRQVAPDLPRAARARLAMLDWYRSHGANVRRTARHCSLSWPTVYGWLRCYDRLRFSRGSKTAARPASPTTTVLDAAANSGQSERCRLATRAGARPCGGPFAPRVSFPTDKPCCFPSRSLHRYESPGVRSRCAGPRGCPSGCLLATRPLTLYPKRPILYTIA